MKLTKSIKKISIIQFFLLITAVSVPAKSLYVHYMPWFQSKGISGNWTHWGDTIPNQTSHLTPLIGLYDSRDPDVLEYQVLLMKYAGLDGLFMDWYGSTGNGPEYGTQPIFQILAKAGLKYAIVWEDRWVNNQGGATPVLQFMENNFFKTANYVKISNRPLLLVWQITYTTGAQWTSNMNSTSFQNKPILITRDNPLTPAAEGAYSWIDAGGGTAKAVSNLDAFIGNTWTYVIPTALPRFWDDYAGFSYGTIDDQSGKMFVNTLTDCMESGKDISQIATWNDWQEGTVIEPSTLYGYRDLEVIQTMRKKYIDPNFSFLPTDLRLPDTLFRLRRQFKGNAGKTAHLDSAANALFQGNPVNGRKILQNLPPVSAIENSGSHTKIPIGSSTATVFDIQGRKILSPDLQQANAGLLIKRLPSGVYIMKKNQNASMRRFITADR